MLCLPKVDLKIKKKSMCSWKNNLLSRQSVRIRYVVTTRCTWNMVRQNKSWIAKHPVFMHCILQLQTSVIFGFLFILLSWPISGLGRGLCLFLDVFILNNRTQCLESQPWVSGFLQSSKTSPKCLFTVWNYSWNTRPELLISHILYKVSPLVVPYCIFWKAINYCNEHSRHSCK